MIYTYNKCIEKYGSDYEINKAIKKRELFKIEKGIYSDEKYVSELEVIAIKYPKAIFTLKSAFYYHGLTDVIPEQYYLSTPKSTTAIRDSRIKQIYDNSNQVELGATIITYNNVNIKIYNKERMLVELIRNKSKLPFDYYKEIILNYRKIINQLDIQAIHEYAYALPKANMVIEILQLEVF